MGSERSTQSFLAHADKISIVSPQVFAFDSFGVIRGQRRPARRRASAREGVKLVPLVMNPGFDQPLDPPHPHGARRARQRAVGQSRRRSAATIISTDLQFDIENVNVADKTAFTELRARVRRGSARDQLLDLGRRRAAHQR